MSVLSEPDYEAMTREAEKYLRAGDLQAATGVQTQLVEKLLESGPKAVHAQPLLAQRLERAASQLVDSLRWARNYPLAIALQERLVEYLPVQEEALRLSTANLRIESGVEAETGLEQFREWVKQAPDDYWYRLSLASAYLYLERFDEAREALQRAVEMTSVRKIDRAIAYKLLHHLYQREGKIEEALAAWREAGRLDSSLRVELLPDVCRMLIVAHQFSEAQKAIALDRVQVRKLFFQGLAAYEDGKPDEATVTWRKLLNLYGPPAQNEGLDEFAETCLRMTSTTSAVMALEALVGRGQTTCWRSTILGLAYAQRGLFDRAVKQLEIALRLGDLDRPRRTLPASGERRVLDANALALYNAIQVDPAIRQRIDAYFSPGS